MSFQISPTLFIGHLNKDNFHKSVNLNIPRNYNHNYSFFVKNPKINNYNNENNYLEPTFDIYTDYKFLKTYYNMNNMNLINKSLDNIENFQNSSNTNGPSFKLSNISSDKYNKMKNLNNFPINNYKNNNFQNNNESKYNTKEISYVNKLKLYHSEFESNNKNKKIRSYSSDKKKNYYFDYKNDDYFDIQKKSKKNDADNSYSLLNNNLNNQNIFYISNNINNQNNLHNIKGIKDKNIIFDNNKRDYKISNILIHTIGDSSNIIDNKNYQNLKEGNRDGSLINYLKIEKEKLIKKNEINEQIINILFYFINQLSKHFFPNKKIFDLTYYYTHLSNLSSDLKDLNQYIINSIKINNYNDNNNKKCFSDKTKKIIESRNYRGNKNGNIGENFSFGLKNKIDYLDIDNKVISNKDKIINNNINNTNRYQHIFNGNNENNVNILGCMIKKNENKKKINSKDHNKLSYINNEQLKNNIQNENDIIKSLNNIIYK